MFIVAATLRSGGETVLDSVWCVACGTRGNADFLSNVVLFTPLGLALALRRTPAFRAILGGLLFSFAIETIQLFVLRGRHANVGDVLANTAGVAVGYYLFLARPWRLARALQVWPTLIVALATSGALIAGLALFSSDFSERPYSLQWNPSYEGHERYQGDVIASNVGRLGPQTHAPTRLAPDSLVLDALSRTRFDITFIAAAPRRGIAPIMSVHDRIGSEIVLLAASGEDLIFRYWAAADPLRLDHPDVRIPNVLAGLQTGDTTVLSVEQRAGEFCATTNGLTRCTSNLSVGRTWNLLISPDSRTADAHWPAFLWMALVFFPVGFLARNLRACMIAMGTTLPLLWFAPLRMGFAPIRWDEVAGLFCGILVAHACAQRSVPGAPPAAELRGPPQPTP
ncbi:MAG TPA: VanZ family protein [Longimicrobiales bacterium]|nr:VanZ family protein [Longimicrobiales bacterium]